MAVRIMYRFRCLGSESGWTFFRRSDPQIVRVRSRHRVSDSPSLLVNASTLACLPQLNTCLLFDIGSLLIYVCVQLHPSTRGRRLHATELTMPKPCCT